MDDLIQRGSSEITEYKRGISLREIAKGVMTRFLPASIVSLFAAVLSNATIGSGQLVPMMGMLVEWAGLVGIGFAVGLLSLSKWLYPDAKAGGLRSVLAGMLAPLLPLVFLWLNAMLGTGLGLRSWEWATLLIFGGVAAAFAMFFPWLTATPPHMRDATYPIGRVAGTE